MDKERMGQIAQLLLKSGLSNAFVRANDIKRWSELLGKSAKIISRRTKIPKEELFAYGVEQIEDAIGLKLPVEDSKRILLSESKKNEIALAAVKHLFYEHGLYKFKDIPRELGNVSKATGLSRAELMEFVIVVTQEALEEISLKIQAKECEE